MPTINTATGNVIDGYMLRALEGIIVPSGMQRVVVVVDGVEVIVHPDHSVDVAEAVQQVQPGEHDRVPA
jgi:hypothetical protein